MAPTRRVGADKYSTSVSRFDRFDCSRTRVGAFLQKTTSVKINGIYRKGAWEKSIFITTCVWCAADTSACSVRSGFHNRENIFP